MSSGNLVAARPIYRISRRSGSIVAACGCVVGELSEEGAEGGKGDDHY